MTKRKGYRVRSGDIARVVLTETAPYEVPLMFSNDGFYKHSASFLAGNSYVLHSLFEKIVCNGEKWFVPAIYKIKKDDISFRRLSLLHPAAQYNFIEFYEKYNDLICYYCSNNQISIRYPKKVGNTFFLKNENENINKYKNNSISTVYTDVISKHPTSYFSYGGYERFYKFFGSPEFLSLEKKYSHLWMLDVSKCFDSIYTHTISWALKSKNFTKAHKSTESFGKSFDELMMAAKHQETNGIVIGPEVSRIFSEIIFQDIDLAVIQQLDKEGLAFNADYSIRRYVDDYIVFAKSEDIAQKATRAIASKLMEYNLHLNEKKLDKMTRPFFTKKSRVIHAISIAIQEFVEKFTEENSSEKLFKRSALVPRRIRNIGKLKKNFLEAIKSIASANACDYSMIANYVISSLCERAVRLIEDGAEQIKDDEKISTHYLSSLLCLLDVMFFMYAVEPTVNASYNLCRAIILSTRFFQKEIPEYEATLKQRVLELFISFYNSAPPPKKSDRGEVIPLELINVLLAIRDMGDDYLIPEEILEHIFQIDDRSHYLELMSCLYYIRLETKYTGLRAKVEAVVRNKLKNLPDAVNYAETAYIVLDSFTCPYFDDSFKTQLVRDLNSQIQAQIPTDAATFAYLKTHPWFINWVNIDLLNLLEKRKLSSVY